MRHSYQNITSPYVNHRFHGIKCLKKTSDECLNKMAGVLEQYNVKVGNIIINDHNTVEPRFNDN